MTGITGSMSGTLGKDNKKLLVVIDPGLYERGQMAVKKGHGYVNVLFESNHTDAFNGKACGVTVVRSAHLPRSEKLAEKVA